MCGSFSTLFTCARTFGTTEVLLGNLHFERSLGVIEALILVSYGLF